MITNLINKILGSPNDKALKKIYPLVEQINQIEQEFQKTITDQNAVLAKTSEFKERLKNGESLDQILPEAFALVKTACRHLQGKEWNVRGKAQKWEIVPYDVQLIGGIVLHQGNISEMKTGEGKTMVCTLPAYLNALTEQGVFIVTVNDYLAQRDAEWMEGLYNYLGLSVGITLHGMDHQAKKNAYNCDIIYGTNNEFGFDYLRDNMAIGMDGVVQRHLNYAIIDEVDSILIDEARTPLIISGQGEESTDKYTKYKLLVDNLVENTDYNVDEKARTASLTEEGITKMEKLMGIDNIYTEAGFTEVHHIEQALRAKACYKSDIDYLIQDGEIIIIDEFTGRLMSGRRYSQGLHQAIEAKENVKIKKESKTLATISFQNYFRLFKKLAGMTGTAETEAEEFYQIYGLDTIIIPTNKKVARQDKADVIFKNRRGKYLAVAEKIKELHKTGRPVLVGTISVEQSELLSKLLTASGITHNILNAKQHEREAHIVENAGQKGGVTIATNMAGRGTDIKISEEVKALGGLFVLGTERHESRRIDNQLRGRSGRQGDPGESQFFISMEDDLLRLFGGDRVQKLMTMMNLPEDLPIENKFISNLIESSQKRVEGRNFDIRKHLVEYDDVMNTQRKIIYKIRRSILEKENIKEEILTILSDFSENLVQLHTTGHPSEWNKTEIIENIKTMANIDENILVTINELEKPQEMTTFVKEVLNKKYQEKDEKLSDPSHFRRIEKAVYLRSIDSLWMEHINTMTDLRESVAFSGYAQKNPLTEYKSQGFQLFNELNTQIKHDTLSTLFKIEIEKVIPEQLLKKPDFEATKTNEQEINNNLENTKTPTIKATSVSYNNFGQINQATDNQNPVIVKVSPSNFKIKAEEKVGRNDPCWCGSGKKYKKCHGQE